MSNNPVYVVNGKEKLNKFHRNEYIRIARELCYPQMYIDRLRLATTESEANRIMITARTR